ncbi:hypothetical protein BHM03_00057076 [Ensete ventricosum]|nr:hypothetical protein BHM03_00057076 [Ensete ventricosum]
MSPRKITHALVFTGSTARSVARTIPSPCAERRIEATATEGESFSFSSFPRERVGGQGEGGGPGRRRRELTRRTPWAAGLVTILSSFARLLQTDMAATVELRGWAAHPCAVLVLRRIESISYELVSWKLRNGGEPGHVKFVASMNQKQVNERRINNTCVKDLLEHFNSSR